MADNPSTGSGRRERQRDPSRFDATFYWHKREDEDAEHQTEEQALPDLIVSGAAFGANIGIGDQANIGFSIDNIEGIGSRLGFALPDVDHDGTVVRHWAQGDVDMPTRGHAQP